MAAANSDGMVMKYEPVIGLEVHVQLLTASKMFCRCSAHYAYAPPNTIVCPICSGMPGSLPAINELAVVYTVKTALALNCEIAALTRFDRKNYPYPDLVKGYQISQYDMPLSENGWVQIEFDGQSRRLGIRRVHLEEDTAKLLHRNTPGGSAYSLVDVNRSGVPLMEIVGEPDIHSGEEARLYLEKLRTILQYLGVSTGRMEEGAMRCDANVSVRPVGSGDLGAKVEIKNMNSFRAVQRALEYEERRQVAAIEKGSRIVQETRGWDDAQGVTISQRSKEFAHDYRYFPEPDLPPLDLSREWVARIKATLPELPDVKRVRFVREYGLSTADALLLTQGRDTAEFFEQAARISNPKAIANWMNGEIRRLLKGGETQISATKLRPEHLVELQQLLDKGTVNLSTAKTVLEEVFNTGSLPHVIVGERGLAQISQQDQLIGLIDEVLGTNPQAVHDYRSGKQQALGFLKGQVMRATKGKANPAVIDELLVRRLG